jgi:hypothetical protein
VYQDEEAGAKSDTDAVVQTRDLFDAAVGSLHVGNSRERSVDLAVLSNPGSRP